MKILSHILIVLLSLSLQATTASDTEGGHDPDHCHPANNLNCLFVGTYAYKLTGNFGASLEHVFSEVGEIVSDGNGHATGKGVSVIDGGQVLHANYTCTYSIGLDRIGNATCTRTDESGFSPMVGLQFAFSINTRGNHVAIEALPGGPAPFTRTQINGSLLR